MTREVAEPNIKALLGGHPKERKEQAQLASPLTHITKDAAPFIIVHGEADPIVPLSQAEMLYKALKSANVSAKLQIGKDRNHGYNMTMKATRRVLRRIPEAGKQNQVTLQFKKCSPHAPREETAPHARHGFFAQEGEDSYRDNPISPKCSWQALVVVALAALHFGILAKGPAIQAIAETQPKAKADTPPSIPADVEIQRDVTYGKGGEVALKMDIYRPKRCPKEPLPVIVYIHGGGWRAGSKDQSAGQLVPFVQRGYCGVSINYRLTPLVRFPEPLYDCKCAIRFLRAKAKELHLDPDHIGVWGHSAGGHLVALLGTTAHVKEFEGTGGWQDYSSRVQAVCTQSGAVEFFKLLEETKNKRNEPDVTALFGGPIADHKAMVQLASPLTHLSKDSAAFLIMHGEADTSCPVTQAELLYKGLKRADASVQLQIGKGGTHGYNDLKVLGEFFDKQLKPKKDAPPPKPPLRPGLSKEKKAGLILPAALPLKGWTLPDEGPAAAPEPPPDFKTGHRVEWEGWTFNWSLRIREGLVLQDVSFRGRKILNYAGLAEIFVAYDQGAQSVDLAIRHSNYGPLPLQPGVDCSSGNWCKAYDAKGKDPTGGRPAVVLMHEEKTGPNYIGMFGRVPGKMLVLWTTMCFSYPDDPDGYIYLIRYKFRDDGTLMPEVGVTGAPRHLRQADTSAVGALVGKDLMDHKVFAESHVHNYLFRLDFAIDGAANNVVEEFNWQKEDGGKGQKANCTWTPIVKETGRSCNAETFRSWRMVNPKSQNALGHPRSYQLIPGNTGVYRSGKQPATQSDLWVTLYKPKEFSYSALDPRTTLEALPKYVDGESVEGKAVVVWYWLGFHHFPRTEDWLHQPVVWKAFELMPRDFLDSSPLKPGK